MTGHSLEPSQEGMKRAEHDVTSGGTGQKKMGEEMDMIVMCVLWSGRTARKKRDGRRSSTDG